MSRSILRILLGLMAVLVLSFAVAACGDDDEEGDSSSQSGANVTNSSSSGAETAPAEPAVAEPEQGQPRPPTPGAEHVSLTVGSKNFPEQFVLGEIYTQALRAGGYKVKKDLNIGSEVVAFKSLRQGEIDAYPEYTGTALTSFFKVQLPEVPKDPAQAYQDAKAAYAKQNITAFAPTPFENTYRLGVTKATAAKLGNPTKISDLAPKASTLAITGYPECRQRTDCLIGVQKAYGMKFKEFVSNTNTYDVLDAGDADVAFVFTTDGPLASKKYVVLDDDKKFFPPYNISFAMRDEVAQKLGAEGKALIENVQTAMTNEVLQELNSRVTLDKKKPAAVAKEYLTQFGYIK